MALVIFFMTVYLFLNSKKIVMLIKVVSIIKSPVFEKDICIHTVMNISMMTVVDFLRGSAKTE